MVDSEVYEDTGDIPSIKGRMWSSEQQTGSTRSKIALWETGKTQRSSNASWKQRVDTKASEEATETVKSEGDTTEGDQAGGGDGDTNDDEKLGGDGDTNDGERLEDGADVEDSAKSKAIDFSQDEKSKDEKEEQALVHQGEDPDEKEEEVEEEEGLPQGSAPAIAFLCAIIFSLIMTVSIISAREATNSVESDAITPTPGPTVQTREPLINERAVMWKSKGQAIFGNENDGFGKQVSISSDGKKIVSSTGASSTTSPYARALEWIAVNDDPETVDADSVDGFWTSMGDDFENATVIAMDGTGDRVAVGYSNPRNANRINDNGLVSIYDWDGMGWNIGANIITSFSGEGASIALSTDGSRVAIGNPKNNQGTGLVNIYELFGSNWLQVGYTLFGENAGDEFGSSITMSGDGKRIAIGAPAIGRVLGSGYVKAYDWNHELLEWQKVGDTLKGSIGLDIDNGDHRIGDSLAMSRDGSTLVVGSYVSSRTSGGAKVYAMNEYLPILGWEPLGSEVLGAVEKTSSTDSSTHGWSSVAVSGDGRRVAIGDSMNDDGGNDAGQVEVYDWTGSRWIKLNPDVEGNFEDELGASVALSDDGETMIIGAPGAACRANSGKDCGLVRVYEFEELSMSPSLVPSAVPTKNPTPAPIEPALPTLPLEMVWTQQGTPVLGEVQGDRLGERLGMSSEDGLRIVASTGGYESPYTRVLEWKPRREEWLQMSNSDFQDSTLGILDGDGGRVAVGYGFNGVDVFEWNGSEWERLGNLLASFSSWTGLALSNDGNRVAIGDPRHNFDVGQVNIFEWNGEFWIQVGTTLFGEAVGDLFGGSLAMSGDGRRVLIGAPESDGLYDGEGNVKVFEWDTEALIWVQIGDTLTGDEAIEFFGRDVDISNDGSTIVVGAYESGGKRGGVKVFSWNADSANWDLMGSELLGDEVNDFFGWCVAISATGRRIAVGSPMNDSTGNDAGLVQVYDWMGYYWRKQGQVVAGESIDDHMGASVVLSDDGEIMAVGAPGRDCSAGLDCGEVRVYKLSPVSPAPITAAPSPSPSTSSASWMALGEDIIGVAANDALGAVGSISSNGLRVAAAASNPLNPYSLMLEWTGQYWSQLGNAFQRSTQIAMDKDGKRVAVRYDGNVEMFDWDHDEWKSVGGLITSFSADGGSLGLSSDGKRVIIGDPDFNSMQGRVYVSKKEGSSWVQVANTLYGDSNGDEFGDSLAISDHGDRIVIGAPKTDLSEGVVRAYELFNDEWIQMGQTLRGDGLLEYYGGSVAMSRDGDTIAIGANGAAAGRGGVMVYTWDKDDERWNVLGSEITGDGVSDNFGWSVDLSADGRRVIIGSPSSDNGGSAPGTGLARVYDWSGSAWVQKGEDIVGGGYSERLGESVSITGDGKAILVGGSGADCIDQQFFCGMVQVFELL